jgi:hypothetical protein
MTIDTLMVDFETPSSATLSSDTPVNSTPTSAGSAAADTPVNTALPTLCGINAQMTDLPSPTDLPPPNNTNTTINSNDNDNDNSMTIPTGDTGSSASVNVLLPFAPGNNAKTADLSTPADGNTAVTPVNIDTAVASTADFVMSAPTARLSDRVQIKFRDQDGNDVTFKVKQDTRMQKIQLEYAKYTGRTLATLRFYFDGERVKPDDTFASVSHSFHQTSRRPILTTLTSSIWKKTMPSR